MRAFLALRLLAFGLAVTASAAVTRLYMKDGTYQVVREWKRDGDRVKFYTTERSEWEEVPAAIVDIPRTEAEIVSKKAATAEEAKQISAEDQALRDQRKEVLKIPQDPGVYTLDDAGKLTIFKLADSQLHSSKGRRALQIAMPLPIVTGKATVEIQEDHSPNIVTNDRQEFYIQLAKEEQFGIIKLTPHHGSRIAERITIEPVVKEKAEDVDLVPIFKKQLAESGLYKIWAEQPMAPGEYAVIEYTPGKVEPQLWDFQVKK